MTSIQSSTVLAAAGTKRRSASFVLHLWFLAALTVFAAACGGTASADATTAEVTTEDLARMVVPSNEFSFDTSGLSVAGDGPLDADAAWLRCDSAESEQEARTLGYVNGYRLKYEIDSPREIGRDDIVLAVTAVHVWRDADAAASAFAQRRDYYVNPCPATVELPQTESEHAEVDVELDSDDATAITYTVVPARGDERAYVSLVIFRVGRFTGQAMIASDTRGDKTEDAAALAATLQGRMEGVAASAFERQPGQQLPVALSLDDGFDSEAAEERFLAAVTEVISAFPGDLTPTDAVYGVEQGGCGGPRAVVSLEPESPVADDSVPLSAEVAVQAFKSPKGAASCSLDARDDLDSVEACGDVFSGWGEGWGELTLVDCAVDHLGGRHETANGWALEHHATFEVQLDGSLYFLQVHRFVAEVRYGAFTVSVETFVAGMADDNLNLRALDAVGGTMAEKLPTLNAATFSLTGEPPEAANDEPAHAGEPGGEDGRDETDDAQPPTDRGDKRRQRAGLYAGAEDVA